MKPDQPTLLRTLLLSSALLLGGLIPSVRAQMRPVDVAPDLTPGIHEFTIGGGVSPTKPSIIPSAA